MPVVEYVPPPPPQLDIVPPKFIKTLQSAVCFEDESITFEGVVTGNKFVFWLLPAVSLTDC